MKRLVFLVFCAGLAWSGWWFLSSDRLETASDAWFEAQRANGAEAEFGSVSIQGFPNRLDQRFKGLMLSDHDGFVRWTAPFLQAFRLVYNPNHVIVAFPPEQQLTIDGTLYTLQSEGLRASFVYGDDGRIERANIEAKRLEISTAAAGMAVTGLTGALRIEPGLQYRVALAAEAIDGLEPAVPAPDAAQLPSLMVELVLAATTPWTTSDRPTLSSVKLERADVTSSTLTGHAKGNVTVGDNGTLAGDVRVELTNWAAALDKARGAGAIEPAVADPLTAALRILQRMSGKDGALDLTLTIGDGAIKIGPLQIGRVGALPRP